MKKVMFAALVIITIPPGYCAGNDAAVSEESARNFNQGIESNRLAADIQRGIHVSEVPALPAKSASRPLHGVWVDMKVLQLDKPELERLVRLARAAGLETLYPAVFRYGCNFYSAPKSPFDCGKEDLLGKFLAVVRKEAPEMRVVPWFERTIHMGALTPGSLYVNTALQEAPDARVDGYRVVDLDNKDVRAHLLESILALRDYGINSVQIDDHLAYDVSPAHSGNSAFKAAPELWKAKLTRFVNWLSAEVRAQAPGFRIEIAQNPRDFAAATYLADWTNWKVDEVVVECYRSSGYAAATDPACGKGRRGVAFLANGVELDDKQILTAAKGLKDRGFVLFHLGRMGNREKLAEELGKILRR
ncbi:MAG: family 10 glycosylhydrolase [Elusimicrobia bacterium]|nr:family 10 glycosylhydrolase [Elusimicrobiota bacterium]